MTFAQLDARASITLSDNMEAVLLPVQPNQIERTYRDGDHLVVALVDGRELLLEGWFSRLEEGSEVALLARDGSTGEIVAVTITETGEYARTQPVALGRLEEMFDADANAIEEALQKVGVSAQARTAAEVFTPELTAAAIVGGVVLVAAVAFIEESEGEPEQAGADRPAVTVTAVDDDGDGTPDDSNNDGTPDFVDIDPGSDGTTDFRVETAAERVEVFGTSYELDGSGVQQIRSIAQPVAGIETIQEVDLGTDGRPVAMSVHSSALDELAGTASDAYSLTVVGGSDDQIAFLDGIVFQVDSGTTGFNVYQDHRGARYVVDEDIDVAGAGFYESPLAAIVGKVEDGIVEDINLVMVGATDVGDAISDNNLEHFHTLLEAIRDASASAAGAAVSRSIAVPANVPALDDLTEGDLVKLAGYVNDYVQGSDDSGDISMTASITGRTLTMTVEDGDGTDDKDVEIVFATAGAGQTSLDAAVITQKRDTDGDGSVDRVSIDGTTGEAADGTADQHEDFEYDSDGSVTSKRLDTDADGTPDGSETFAYTNGATRAERDSDNDGTPDRISHDADSDGNAELIEHDDDDNGTIDRTEHDADSDGTPERIVHNADAAGVNVRTEDDANDNGTIERTRHDANGDGTPERIEYDQDENGTIDLTTSDSDGDGYADLWEWDTDEDGTADFRGYDTDNNGTVNYYENRFDRGGAQLRFDYDRDENGTIDLTAFDSDGDRRAELLHFDTDEDGTPEATGYDTDDDGRVNYYEIDSNQDGTLDGYILDEDDNGSPDFSQVDSDQNGVFESATRSPDATGSRVIRVDNLLVTQPSEVISYDRLGRISAISVDSDQNGTAEEHQTYIYNSFDPLGRVVEDAADSALDEGGIDGSLDDIHYYFHGAYIPTSADGQVRVVTAANPQSEGGLPTGIAIDFNGDGTVDAEGAPAVNVESVSEDVNGTTTDLLNQPSIQTVFFEPDDTVRDPENPYWVEHLVHGYTGNLLHATVIAGDSIYMHGSFAAINMAYTYGTIDSQPDSDLHVSRIQYDVTHGIGEDATVDREWGEAYSYTLTTGPDEVTQIIDTIRKDVFSTDHDGTADPDRTELYHYDENGMIESVEIDSVGTDGTGTADGTYDSTETYFYGPGAFYDSYRDTGKMFVYKTVDDDRDGTADSLDFANGVTYSFAPGADELDALVGIASINLSGTADDPAYPAILIDGVTTLTITDEVLSALADRDGDGTADTGYTLTIDSDGTNDVVRIGAGIEMVAGSDDGEGRVYHQGTDGVIYIDPDITVEAV